MAPVRRPVGFPHLCFLFGGGLRPYRQPETVFATVAPLRSSVRAAFRPDEWGHVDDWSRQNVLWTLALGLCAMTCVGRAPRETGWQSLLWLFGAAGCCLTAELLHTDYGAFGVLLCLLFYCTIGQRGRFWLCGGIFLLLCFGLEFVPLPGTFLPLEAFGVLAFPLLSAYRGRRWRRRPLGKHGFYWFYPLHMLILGLLS